MTKNKASNEKPGRKSVPKQIIDEARENHAFEILHILSKEDPKIKKRIEEIAARFVNDVDLDGIAEDIFEDLELLRVEDVWDNSGPTRDGYVDPYELAYHMFEEVVDPYIDELKKYLKLKMYDEAGNYCMGIIKGLDKYKNEATSEFSDWAPDEPNEFITTTLDEWKKGCKDTKWLKKVDEFVKTNFPNRD